eukprot:scaffold1170_cov174-Amphora_coffeaeformis.AAC.28
MHPLVCDLYKPVLHVDKDYPIRIPHVKQVWKRALCNPANCPSCYAADPSEEACEEENLQVVYKRVFYGKGNGGSDSKSNRGQTMYVPPRRKLFD